MVGTFLPDTFTAFCPEHRPCFFAPTIPNIGIFRELFSCSFQGGKYEYVNPSKATRVLMFLRDEWWWLILEWWNPRVARKGTKIVSGSLSSCPTIRVRGTPKKFDRWENIMYISFPVWLFWVSISVFQGVFWFNARNLQKGQKVVRFSTSAVGRDLFWKKNSLANAKYGGKIESHLQISDN